MKLIKQFMLMMVVALVAISCSQDSYSNDYGDYPNGVIWQGHGDIILSDGESHTVLDDDLDTILITNGEAFRFDLGDRVSFAGDLISTDDSGKHDYYTFRATRMDLIPTSTPELRSSLAEDAVLGDDIIKVTSASVTDRYINVNYIIYESDEDIKHDVVMVIDDVDGSINVVNGVLELDVNIYHDANRDLARYERYGYSSFRIEDYTKNLSEINTIKVNISYQQSATTVSKVTIDNSTKAAMSIQ